MRDPIELLDEHFDGLLDEAGAAELRAWVKQDPRHARMVVDAAMLHQTLREVLHGRRLLEESASANNPLTDCLVMPAIRLGPEDAGAPPVVAPPVPPVKAAAPPPARRWRWVAIIVLPILLGTALWGVFRPAGSTGSRGSPTAGVVQPANIGSLVATAAATWADPAHAPRAGQPLPRGPSSLTSGLAQVRLDNGVSLIFEGPAKFEIKSQAAVVLSLGKLTVNVPPDAHGFTVETPSARTVDLGTEFGVVVDDTGNTETHVIRGTVEVTPIAGGTTTRLTVDDAARVDFGANSTKKIVCLAGNFVQDVPAIDLVDVIAGGNGTQRRSDSGIDVGTGKILPLPANRRAMTIAGSQNVTGDRQFHRCPGRSMIGGVFVPHGGPTPDIIDPAGHQFNFPTTDNHAYLNFWPLDITKLARGKGTRHDVIGSGVIGSIDYSAAGHRLLLLHANKGVSFDLNALRNAHSDRPFSHLQAVCVNLYANDAPNGSKMSDRSEFWVFVDGDLRSHRLIHRTDPPFDVDVPIEPSAHYLTIAATDGGDGFDWDVVSLGDPRLN
jgi:hypothetical protein